MGKQTPQKTNTLSGKVLMFIVLALALLPAVTSLVMAFFKYYPNNPKQIGPFIGFSYFKELISGFYLPMLAVNSFTLWLAGFAGSMVIGLVAAILCSRIRSTKISATVAGLFLLPAFIPATIYQTIAHSAAVQDLFNPESLSTNMAFWLDFALRTFLPGLAVIAFSGIAVSMIFRSKGRSPAAGALMGCAGAGLLVCMTTMMPDYEAVKLVFSAELYKVADTFDTYIIRRAILDGNISYTAAIYIIRVVMQIALALVPAFLLVFWLKKQEKIASLAPVSGETHEAGRMIKNILPWFLATIFSLAVLLFMGLPNLDKISQLRLNILPTLATVALGAVICLVLSMAVIRGLQMSGRGLFVVFAVLILVTANAMYGQFVLASLAGLTGTIWPPALTAWLLPRALTIILAFALINRFGTGKRAALYFSLSAACLVAALIYGGFILDILFVSIDSQMTPGGMFFRVLENFSAIININGSMIRPTFPTFLYMIVALPCLLLGFAGAALARKALLTRTAG